MGQYLDVNGNVASMAPSNLPPEADADAIPEPAQWVRRAREGDEVAFALLVRRHERMVLRTALRLLGRMDLAQDAAQEAFLRLHRNLGRIDESLELGPWLYRVVVNVSRDLNRRWRWPRIVGLEHLQGSALVDTRSARVEVDLERNDRLRLVQAALLTLPLKEREAIVLRDLEGLTTAEVAQVLGSSEGTVRSQISTGRLKIRAYVEAQGAKR
jgi:RNA polymerase sigma-70 factor (ECF subfamily)